MHSGPKIVFKSCYTQSFGLNQNMQIRKRLVSGKTVALLITSPHAGGRKIKGIHLCNCANKQKASEVRHFQGFLTCRMDNSLCPPRRFASSSEGYSGTGSFISPGSDVTGRLQCNYQLDRDQKSI